jgi:hypothetical protein
MWLVIQRPHENLELIRQVLKNEYLELKIDKLIIEDDARAETTTANVHLSDSHGLAQTVTGTGPGMVGALWSGFLTRYASEYQSLQSVTLANFSVIARLDTKTGKDGTDAVAEVKLDVRNSDGRLFSFADSSRRMGLSTARAVTAAIEYFVNAERAFITLYKSRQDAKDRNRDDLVTRYTRELAEVVKSTSYAEVIENIKKQIS